MTIDELVNAVNDSWGWAYVELARKGDGKWTSHFQVVEVDGLEQPFFKGEMPVDAIMELVWFLRGRRIRHRQVSGGVGGKWVDVPSSLEVMNF